MSTGKHFHAPAQGAQPHHLQRRAWLAGALVVAATAWLGALAPAQAALVVSPTSLSLELAPGETGIIRGDITNTTGFDLLSTDLFGSFSGYPSDALVIDQLLGLTDLSIDDRAVTRGLELFSVQLGAGAVAGQSYSIEFFFGDINGNFSPSATVLVTVPGAQPLPEPGIAWLLGCGMLGLAATSRCRRPHVTQEG
jgi:hypothetical protein